MRIKNSTVCDSTLTTAIDGVVGNAHPTIKLQHLVIDINYSESYQIKFSESNYIIHSGATGIDITFLS